MEREPLPLLAQHMCTYECREELSLCKSCMCMTWTIHNKCGKCKAEKLKEENGPTKVS